MLSAILLIIFTSYILKPMDLSPAADKMECCAKTGCEKHDSRPQKNPCKDSGCSMVSCPYGNYYKPGFTDFHFGFVPGIQKEFFTFDDNRLSFISPDCWHPPKQV